MTAVGREGGVAVISVHDVAPVTLEACDRLIGLAERIDARCSLLVIPGPWRMPMVADSDSFVSWLHLAVARGHEVVVHGWEHRAVRDDTGAVGQARRAAIKVATRGCAEFASLGSTEAFQRADRGRDVLRSVGFTPVGFTPPGWSASPAAVDALASVGFQYTTTRTAVVDLSDRSTIAIPALSHRPYSPMSRAAARAVETIVQRRCRAGRSVRLALHPNDVADSRIMAASNAAVTALGRSDLEVLTYEGLIARHRGATPTLATADRGVGP